MEVVESVESEVIGIIAGLVENPPGKIENNMSIQNDMGADDLDLIFLLIAIEDKYGFNFEDNALTKFKKLSEIVNEIKKRSGEKRLKGKCINLRKIKNERQQRRAI